jgi:small subunit ribosomal protein S6
VTRRYEIVYIFDSALDEKQVDTALNRHQALLKPDGEDEFIIETNHWGRRTLAYPIGKSEVGYYVVVNLKTTGDKMGEFERSIKLDESIIRHLIVLNEGEIPVPIPPADADHDRDDDDGPRRRFSRDSRDRATSVKPATEAQPATEDAPVTEAQPATEDAPVTETQPATEDTPATESKSASESEPAEAARESTE